MARRVIWAGLAVILMAVLLVGVVRAQQSATFSLAWYALAGGGERAASTHYAMQSTVGQAATGLSTGTSFAMSSGYWQGWPDFRVFLPLVVRGA